jgi:DNA damage-binding protein 1
LDNGYAFLGSHFGDSSLIRILEEPDSSGNNLRTVHLYPNIGPITDFVIMDSPGKPGSGQLVTCSGAFRDGSLRVVKHGIEIKELLFIDLPTISRVFSCCAFSQDSQDLVVLSTGACTVFLRWQNQELVLETFPFERNQPTLAVVGDSSSKTVVQVTPYRIVKYDLNRHQGNPCSQESMCIASWELPTDGCAFVDAHIHCNYVAVLTRATLMLFSLDSIGSGAIGSHTFKSDLSCVDIDPTTNVIAVGLWDRSVLLLSLPDLKVISQSTLNDFEARSIKIAQWASCSYLICGRGDGTLETFEIDIQGNFGSSRKIAIGTEPIRLSRFQREGKTLIFGSCDHPVVLHANSAGKLLYSSVNLSVRYSVNVSKSLPSLVMFWRPCITYAVCIRYFKTTSLDACTIQNSVVGNEGILIAVKDGLQVGLIEPIENIHVSTSPLNGEMARRIAYISEVKCLAVLTERQEEGGLQEEVGFLKLYDELSLEVISCERLSRRETPLSLCVQKLPNGECIVFVGTAFVNPGDEEPTEGRILGFKVVKRELILSLVTNVKGAVYCISSLPGRYLAAGINNRVFVFGIPDTTDTENFASTRESNQKLEQICSQSGFILALYVDTRGDFIIVGDLMKSVTILLFHPGNKSIELIAKDPAPSWVTSVAAFDDDHVLATDADCNFYVAKRNHINGSNPDDDLKRKRLEVVAEMHTGDFINRIRAGCIHPVDDCAVVPAFVTVSTSGRLGIFGHVANQHNFDLFLALQQEIAEQKQPLGNFKYQDFRSFTNFRKSIPMHGIVDGDIIEKYLDLTWELKSHIAQNLSAQFGRPITVETLVQLVEDVSRLH